MNTTYSITLIENAINYWRAQSPATGDELALCREASAIANVYARMIVGRLEHVAIGDVPADADKAIRTAMEFIAPNATA